MSIERYKTLYNIDSKGNYRTWWMERDGNAFRTVTGIEGGALVESGWKYARATNVGQSNERSDEDQADFIIKSSYETKLKRTSYAADRGSAGRPKIFGVMLAAKYKDLFGGKKPKCKIEDGFYEQPKLDGFRCIATAEGLFSRNGERFVSAPHIEKALEPFFTKFPEAVLDGELYNHELRNDFSEVQKLVKREKLSPADFAKTARLVQYHIYDCPVSYWTTSKTWDDSAVEVVDDAVFSQRYMFLLAQVPWAGNSCLQAVETGFVKTQEALDEKYARYLEEEFEGQMLRKDTPYANKRGADLIKRKEFEDDEFEIVRLEEGTGNWAGAAKRLVGRTNGKQGPVADIVQFEAGIAGKKDRGAVLLAEAADYVGGTATVRYFGYGVHGRPRFGVVYALYKRGEDRHGSTGARPAAAPKPVLNMFD